MSDGAFVVGLLFIFIWIAPAGAALLSVEPFIENNDVSLSNFLLRYVFVAAVSMGLLLILQ